MGLNVFLLIKITMLELTAKKEEDGYSVVVETRENGRKIRKKYKVEARDGERGRGIYFWNGSKINFACSSPCGDSEPDVLKRVVRERFVFYYGDDMMIFFPKGQTQEKLPV